MFEIVIKGEQEAQQILRRKHDYTHLISLRGSTSPRAIEGFDSVANRLQLNFDDLSTSRSFGRFVPPREAHIQSILDFGSGIENGAKVLVHCAQGVSRSTAAAYIMLASILGSGNEREALKLVVAERPQARPNQLMVAMADNILGSRGALLKHVEMLRYERRSRPYGGPG